MLPSASPRRASGLIALIALRLVAARALADDAARSARPPVADESVADARRLQTSEPSSARPPVATDAVADARRLQTSEPTSVEPFDCDVHSKPLQILKERDTRLYVLTELDVATGEHVTVGPKDWTLRQVNATGDNTLNAAAMWDSVDGSYIFAAVNTGPPEKPLSRLCRLDHSRLDCVEHPLTLQRPSVGAIVGDTYIYNKAVGSRVGDRFYAVHNIGGDPGPEDFTSAADAAVQISNKLWETSINDVAALVETGRDLVVDDDPNGRYLIGINRLLGHILIARVNWRIEVDVYAVVPVGKVSWQGKKNRPDDWEHGVSEANFGSAFAYSDGLGGVRIFFAADNGWGLFEADLPLDVRGCWNLGFDVESHVLCENEEATLTFRMPSQKAAGSDGLNCPRAPLEIPATDAPTPLETAAPTEELTAAIRGRKKKKSRREISDAAALGFAAVIVVLIFCCAFFFGAFLCARRTEIKTPPENPPEVAVVEMPVADASPMPTAKGLEEAEEAGDVPRAEGIPGHLTEML
mmetsp:Transcript_17048/g.52437  ORF Transcript_17048/g.52437 Transcript_17048/m.52437 type:complete len:524 (+) Transcript_17048:271-1842(+)